MAAFIVLGSVLEGIPAIVLFGPLLFPIAKQVGVHEVHYAMVIILAMGIGLFAPPFGVGYYAACAISRVHPDEGLKPIVGLYDCPRCRDVDRSIRSLDIDRIPVIGWTARKTAMSLQLDKRRWDLETDLLVIGAGAAGMTAALVGALEGLNTILCEKSDMVGGTTATSAGTVWIPGSRQSSGGRCAR